MYPDGSGLYLQVSSPSSKSWIYRYAYDGRSREMGLGSIAAVSLAVARQKAQVCRELRAAGTDPLEERRARRAVKKLAAAKAITFDAAAEAYIASHRSGWRSARYADQWTTTIAAHVSPVFGKLSVETVDTELVLKALEPIWHTRPNTAAYLRGRIESILDWAAARGCRSGENPARWRGHLDKLLPAAGKMRAVTHRAAMPYAELKSFLERLRARRTAAACALEFTILTAARTGEVIGATWKEFDLSERVWTVPAERMKNGRTHRVPLSLRTLALLNMQQMSPTRDDAYVFVGQAQGRHISQMTMIALLRRMQLAEVTVHGFRSTFRDWAAEQTSTASEVIEMALAHALPSKVEAAYFRSDLFEKRRTLMNEWAAYCS